MKPASFLLCALALFSSLAFVHSDDELDLWRKRASEVSVGMRRSVVEQLLPTYSPRLPTSGRLTLPNGVNIAIPTPEAGTLDYMPRFGFRSGLHQVEMYSVAPAIVVTAHYSVTDKEEANHTLLDPVTVERRSFRAGK